MRAGSSEATYARPTTLPQALERLSEGGWSILAGGTDFYPARVGAAVTGPVLDITSVAALAGFSEDSLDGRRALRIGALTTWTQLTREALPVPMQALAQAARGVGGLQIQNQGTIGGNLCNASPAADGVPALLALGAAVELASAAAVRRLPVREFVLGNRRTARRPDELLTAVLVPQRSAAARSLFLKLGNRRYLVISTAMVALAIDLDASGRIADCAVAVGACSETARRLTVLEQRVNGMSPQALVRGASRLVTDDTLAVLSPIDDVRGTAAYRREATARLVERGLAELAQQVSEARQ